jgi:hypothetical protein
MRRVWLGLGMALGLAGCGGPPPPPVVYKPLDFSYLPPITLKVATVNVTNAYVPGPDEANLIAQAPEAPANAVTDLLNRRLIPSGAPGSATVTIETASLDEQGGSLIGTMTVDVQVASANGLDTGSVEASVTHTDAAPDPNASQAEVQAALYAMTKTLTDELNDRLQYELQHNLGMWIVYNTGLGVTPSGGGASAIVATPLPGPGAAPAGAAPAAAPAPGAAPPPAPAGTTPPPAANGLPLGSLPLGTLPLGTVPVPPSGNGQLQ